MTMPRIACGLPPARGLARATGLAASQGFRTASRVACDAGASPRHALLAESLGRPSLWVIISAPRYEPALRKAAPVSILEAEGAAFELTVPVVVVGAGACGLWVCR